MPSQIQSTSQGSDGVSFDPLGLFNPVDHVPDQWGDVGLNKTPITDVVPAVESPRAEQTTADRPSSETQTSPEAVTISVPPPITPEEKAALISRWKSLPLLHVLPEQFRSQVAPIVDRNPRARTVLQWCKEGKINCWQALRLLGIDPWGEEDNQPINQTDDKEVTL